MSKYLKNFYPRSPCGERLFADVVPVQYGRISIHALLAESDSDPVTDKAWALISIHALLAESDMIAWSPDRQARAFLSTLSLRRATPDVSIFNLGGQFLSTLSLRRATSTTITTTCIVWKFLSTLSLRRATWLEIFLYYQDNNFYPRSPCGERRQNYECFEWIKAISIHALLAESDA